MTKKKSYSQEHHELQDQLPLFSKILEYIRICIKFLYNISCLKKKRSKKNSELSLNFQKPRYIEISQTQNVKKLNLFLELEGVLVRTSHKPWNDSGPEERVTVIYQSGIHQDFYVRKRPFLKEFLEQCQQHYNIFIYTTQIKEYADAIIDILPITIQKRFYREDCLNLKSGRFQKELLKITKKLNIALMIDCSKTAIQGDLQNSILIKSFSGKVDDTELISLAEILQDIANDNQSSYEIQQVIENLKDEKDLNY